MLQWHQLIRSITCDAAPCGTSRSNYTKSHFALLCGQARCRPGTVARDVHTSYFELRFKFQHFYLVFVEENGLERIVFFYFLEQPSNLPILCCDRMYVDLDAVNGFHIHHLGNERKL